MVIAALAGMFNNPYAGLVIFIAIPALFVTGLVFIPVGMWLQERKVRRDPNCAVCGDKPTIREVADLEWSCHVDRPRPETVAAR